MFTGEAETRRGGEEEKEEGIRRSDSWKKETSQGKLSYCMLPEALFGAIQ